jgi:hypothetical protein
VTSYEKGSYYERLAYDAFEREGYECWLTRGSKGAADLIAAKPGQLVLVQVKGALSPITHDGWNGLLDLAKLVGGIPVVADWPRWKPSRAGPLRLRRIRAAHLSRKQTWPADLFPLDICLECGQYPHRPTCPAQDF